MNSDNSFRAEKFTIGKLAEAASVNVETVRYYERKGLLEQPKKPKSGYRQYNGSALKIIIFIKRAQELGFTLKEIENLIAISEGSCSGIQKIAEQKISTIERKVEDLNHLLSTLENLVSLCKQNKNKQKCPIIESIIPNKQC